MITGGTPISGLQMILVPLLAAAQGGAGNFPVFAKCCFLLRQWLPVFSVVEWEVLGKNHHICHMLSWFPQINPLNSTENAQLHFFSAGLGIDLPRAMLKQNELYIFRIGFGAQKSWCPGAPVSIMRTVYRATCTTCTRFYGFTRSNKGHWRGKWSRDSHDESLRVTTCHVRQKTDQFWVID